MKRDESPMARAYGLWLEHTGQCDECKRVSEAEEGCQEGRNLWGSYRLARVGADTGPVRSVSTGAPLVETRNASGGDA